SSELVANKYMHKIGMALGFNELLDHKPGWDVTHPVDGRSPTGNMTEAAFGALARSLDLNSAVERIQGIVRQHVSSLSTMSERINGWLKLKKVRPPNANSAPNDKHTMTAELKAWTGSKFLTGSGTATFTADAIDIAAKNLLKLLEQL